MNLNDSGINQDLMIQFIYLDDNNGASANLSWFAFFVDFTQTAPFAQFFVWIHTDQWNLMFVAQSRDQFFVLWLFAAFSQNS